MAKRRTQSKKSKSTSRGAYRAPEARRTKVIRVNATEAQHAMLKAAADAEGRSLSSWVLEQALEAAGGDPRGVVAPRP